MDGDGTHRMVELEEISDCASREHALETALDKMQADWQPLVFDLVPWRATGSYILKVYKPHVVSLKVYEGA